MQPETNKYLHDILKACEAILGFVDGKDFRDYESDLLLRSGVERQLMIAGEALSQAARADESIAVQIEHTRDIINLRNVIAHGYAVVEDETIWGIVQADVPQLHQQVRHILK